MSEGTTPVSAPPRSHKPPGRLTTAEMKASELARQNEELADKVIELEERVDSGAHEPPVSTEQVRVRLEARNQLWDKVLQKQVLWPLIGGVVLLAGLGIAGVTGHLPTFLNTFLELVGMVPGVDAPAQ